MGCCVSSEEAPMQTWKEIQEESALGRRLLEEGPSAPPPQPNNSPAASQLHAGEAVITVRNTKLLEDIDETLIAKMERTDVKIRYDEIQRFLDYAGFGVGSVAGGMAPGIGGIVSDITLGLAKTTAAAGAISARNKVDMETQQYGRIETNAYEKLKKAYNEPSSLIDKKDIMTLTKSLFDISEEQALALFKRSDEHDLVSAKEIIRLRFTNLTLDALKERAG